MFHTYTKHIEEKGSQQEKSAWYTQSNLADLFIKALPHEYIKAFCKVLGVFPSIDAHVHIITDRGDLLDLIVVLCKHAQAGPPSLFPSLGSFPYKCTINILNWAI